VTSIRFRKKKPPRPKHLRGNGKQQVRRPFCPRPKKGGKSILKRRMSCRNDYNKEWPRRRENPAAKGSTQIKAGWHSRNNEEEAPVIGVSPIPCRKKHNTGCESQRKKCGKKKVFCPDTRDLKGGREEGGKKIKLPLQSARENKGEGPVHANRPTFCHPHHECQKERVKGRKKKTPNSPPGNSQKKKKAWRRR